MATDDSPPHKSTKPVRSYPRLGLTVSWESCDGYRWVAGFAIAGLLAASVMAVVSLPPVDFHPPWHRFGVMDPLCGGTRAARFTVQGKWSEAWNYNPLGVLTIFGAGAVVLRSLVGVVSGRWLHVWIRWTPRRIRTALAIGVVLVTLLEIRQQLRADLLIAGT